VHDAPAAIAPVAAVAAPLPPRPDPRCVLARPESEIVAGLRGGRIDGLKLAALPNEARLDVDVARSSTC
jgi:hypothetical protein